MATILRLKDIGKIWHIERTKEEVMAFTKNGMQQKVSIGNAVDMSFLK